MKARIFVAAALLACACAPVRNDLEKYGLNCKVSEVSVESDSPEKNYTARFNSKGQLTEIETYNDDGAFRFRESYIYGPDGSLSEILGVNSEDETENRYEYEWDGRFVRECRMYGMNNEELHRWVHTNNGRHIVRTEYYSEGEFGYETVKVYGNGSYEESSADEDGNLIGTATVEFLSDTKPTRMTSSNGMHVEIDYNSDGLPVRSLGTVLTSTCEMEWEPALDEQPERFYSYEFDSRGNWTVRTERCHPDSSVIYTIRRTISY